MHTRRFFGVLALSLGLILALLVGLGGLAPAQADPGTLFVKPDGTGTACTQANPCDLQTALSQANDGDTIYVAGGIYTGTGDAVIALTKSITLYGGWDGASTGPVVRNPALYPTTLDGEWARRVVSITGNITPTLDGLTIIRGQVLSTTIPPTQGSRWDGAGLYAKDVALTLRDTRFYSNSINVYGSAGSYAYGGGASVEGGSLTVERATFRWNSAWATGSSLGGGLSISGTLAATITNSLFQDNDAWVGSGLLFEGPSNRSPLVLLGNVFADNGRGNSVGVAYGGYASAAYIDYARARIENNTFQGGSGNDWGAVRVSRSDLLFARNVVYNNGSYRTSGLYLSSVSPFTLTNNVIAGNISTSVWENAAIQVLGGSGRFLHNTVACNKNAVGLLVQAGASVALTNTILVSHTVGISVGVGSAATLQGTLWGSGLWANGVDWASAGTILTGTVNLWGDPAFLNPGGGDYHITAASAARDAGVDAGVTTDIDGDLRPIGAGYDIGADEYIARVYLPLVLRNY